jgi:hypothetical protein
MRNNKFRKLTLAKNTLRTLSPADLQDAAGGTGTYNTCGGSCQPYSWAWTACETPEK